MSDNNNVFTITTFGQLIAGKLFHALGAIYVKLPPRWEDGRTVNARGPRMTKADDGYRFFKDDEKVMIKTTEYQRRKRQSSRLLEVYR